MTRFQLVLDRLLTDGLVILRSCDEPVCDCGVVWDGTFLHAYPADVEALRDLMEEARRLLDAGASLQDGGQGR